MKFNNILLVCLLLLLPVNGLLGGEPPSDKARGLFMALGVGPRLPLGGFLNSNALGYGLQLEFDYTDTEYLPFFLYGKVGVVHFPGASDYYKKTDYSNYTVTMVPISFGGRYYFEPLMNNVFLFMPHVEGGVDFIFYENLNQFKAGSGLPNYTDDGSKIGLNVGVGFSMFLMEITGNYHLNKGTSYGSLDFKVRVPLFASI